MDAPVLLIAAIVVAALLIFAIIRKITALIVITVALGLIVAGLYVARSADYLTW